jgi:predicted aspartyl protease
MKLTHSIFLCLFLVTIRPMLGANTSSSDGAPFLTHINGAVSVPAEVVGHVMFVSVMVNGHGPFRVMVDTGCSVTIVSPDLAEAVGAIIEDQNGNTIVAQNGLGNPTNVQQILLESVDLGGAHFEGVTAAVSDSFDGLSAINGRRVDGALGFPLFQELFLGLDFPNQRLLLGNDWPASVTKPQTGLTVIEHLDVPFVQVQIQGKPIEVMIDTGANQALQLPVGLANSLQWKVEPRVGSLVAAFGEVGRECIGRLSGSLLLGDIEQVEPTAIVSTGPASLGLRSLERFCVVFHQTENKVWLCGPNPSPILPTTERSIGLSLYSDQGGLRIAGVIPGSPAEKAHMTVGSLITKVEGLPALNWTRDQIEQWIDSHVAIVLGVTDKTGEHALTLPVWDLVP